MQPSTLNTSIMQLSHILPPLLLLAVATAGSAQATRGVVIDLETRKPLGNVDIIINGSYVNKAKTNYKGEFTIVGTVSDLTFCRQGYEYRKMTLAELKDTIDLLPNYNKLNEVVVIGRKPGAHMPVLSLIDGQLKAAPKQPRTAVVEGDFLGWLRIFEKGHVSAKKRRERMKAIENY